MTTDPSDKDEGCTCFWHGGFVYYSAVFLSGVLITLTLLIFSLRTVTCTCAYKSDVVLSTTTR